LAAAASGRGALAVMAGDQRVPAFPVKLRLPAKVWRTRRRLSPDTAWSLSDGLGGRWPVADGIAYLRTGREALVREAVARLDAGERNAALASSATPPADRWPWSPAAPPARRVRRRPRRSGPPPRAGRSARTLVSFGR